MSDNLSMQNFISNLDIVKQNAALPQTKPQGTSIAPIKTATGLIAQNNAPVTQKTQIINETPADILVFNDNFEDEVKNAKRKNGFVEKIYDSIKNVGFGFGSRALRQRALNARNGAISKQDFENDVAKYRTSQENFKNGLADALSILTSSAVFFGLKNKRTNGLAVKELSLDVTKELEKAANSKKISKFLIGIFENDKKFLVAATLLSALTAGITKRLAVGVNNIGSKRYKADESKQMTPEELKAQKKALRKEKRKDKRRTFASGAINGLFAPITATAGVAGVAASVALNTLNRYFVADNIGEKKKSFGGYINSVINNPVTNILTSVLIALPLLKNGKFAQELQKNSDEVVKNLKNATLTPVASEDTVYTELETVLENNPVIKNILNSNIPDEEKIIELTKENIFAVKFRQIQSAAGDNISKLLKENCPPSRTEEAAAEEISKVFNDKYIYKQRLGVGTVAETYLVEEKGTGREFCIKMLKDGITPEKIAADKKAFRQMIQDMPDVSKEYKTYLLNNADSIADGVAKEVDFQNEYDAAIKLAKTTKAANVVTPTEVKDGMYVMERARGVSLDSFAKLMALNSQLDALNSGRYRFSNEELKTAVYKIIEEKIDDVMKRTPAFENIELTSNDRKYLFEEYMKVLVEQFNKVNPKGTTIHGDIHPGNVIIDLEALKSRKGKVFTLIDTGNTIDVNMEQALRFMNLTKYLKDCDINNLAKFALDGATLPKGLSYDTAFKNLTNDLEKAFCDYESGIGNVDNDNFIKIANTLMSKQGIIPSDTQGNLLKAKRSANNSLKDLRSAFYVDSINKINNKSANNIANANADGNAKASMLKTLKDITQSEFKYLRMKKSQQHKNLLLMPPSERIKHKKGSGLAKNSEKYLTYKYKQYTNYSLDKVEEKLENKLGDFINLDLFSMDDVIDEAVKRVYNLQKN